MHELLCEMNGAMAKTEEKEIIYSKHSV